MRDWRNFDLPKEGSLETPWSAAECERSTMSIEDDFRETFSQLRLVFEQVTTHYVPTPGTAVDDSEKMWRDGGLEKIDPDFVRFVDRHFRQIFGRLVRTDSAFVEVR